MRLIDADKLKEHIHKIVAEQKGRNIDLVPVGELPILIDKQPTAYDVDKVVEQLEDRRKTAEQLVMENPHDELDRIQTQTAEDFASAYNDAIEIVKQEAEQYEE